MSDLRIQPPHGPTPCALTLPEGSLAALVHDMQTPLLAIGNAAFLLTLTRDDVTAQKMLSLIGRQLGYFSSISDMLGIW